MSRAASVGAAQAREDFQDACWGKLMWRIQEKDSVEVRALLLDIAQLAWVD